MSGLRVTGGELRGRRVPLPGHELRPTSEKARQAFFNIVATRVVDASFLDLFSGSGIFSIEAVSRGAARATAVDQSRPSMQSLQQMAREWKLPIQTMAADVMKTLKQMPEELAFDLVYADPPYRYPRYEALIEAIDKANLKPGAVVGVEHDKSEAKALSGVELGRLRFRRTAVYGTVAISIFDMPSEV